MSKIQLTDLEIVGYSDPPPEYLRPGYVAAIFRDKKTQEIILPPYQFISSALEGGTRDSEIILKKLVWLQSVVKLDTPIIPKEDFALWLDEDGRMHYDSREKTKTFLHVYSMEKLSAARKAFEEGKHEETLTLAQRALNADENCVAAVKIKQEVYKLQGNQEFVDELEYLIKFIEESMNRNIK